MVCDRDVLQLGDDNHAVEEGGRRGGRKWPLWCSEVRARCYSNNGGKGVEGVRLTATRREGWRGGGSVGCGSAGSRAGEAGEEREGRKQGRLASGAWLTEARERVIDGAGYNADGLN
jgi:hypothetical protein